MKSEKIIYRYERKFCVDKIDKVQIESIIKKNPAFFKEIFEERIVNNFYFDTRGFQSYIENTDGIMDRTKYRIRWYGKTFDIISNPVLELKIKKGLLGTKKKFELQPISTLKVNHSVINNSIEFSDIPKHVMLKLKLLIPIISNSYKRKYFLSADKKFRLTLDTDQKFKKFNNSFISKDCFNLDSIVVEIKYDSDCDYLVNNITNHFPFRLTKNSKFVNGVKRLYMV